MSRVTVGDLDQEDVVVNLGHRNDKHAHLSMDCERVGQASNPEWKPTACLFHDMPVCGTCVEEIGVKQTAD